MTSTNASQKQQSILQKAITLQESGQLVEAIHTYKKLLKLTPKDPQLLNTLGMIALQLDNFKEGLNWLEQSLKISPNQTYTLSNCGFALQELKHYSKALAYHDRALALKPDYIDAHYNSGLVLQALKRYEEALLSFDTTIALHPNDADAYYNRSISLKELKRYDEALISIDKVISLQPEYADAYCNRGTIFKKLKRHTEALINFDQAISLNPDYAEAHCNRGSMLYELKNFNDALLSFSCAIALNPEYAEAYSNSGTVLKALNRFDEALTKYELACNLNPDIDYLQGQRLFTRMQACQWNNFSKTLSQLINSVENKQNASMPFELLGLTDRLEIHRKTAEICVEALHPSNIVLSEINAYPKHSRLRIGYFSADFKNHPVAFLTAELYEVHNRNQFEIYAFSFSSTNKDEMRVRLEAGFDHFFDVHHLSDKEITLLARSHEIDIAVDLGGFTGDSRPGIFAMRAAPVQVNYLGFSGTMGAHYIDYLIADKTLIPEENQHFYSEKIVYLPNSFMVNDTQNKTSRKPTTKIMAGLPTTGFIFCCFNNHYKITPDTFAGWMRILKQVKGSVLWLPEGNSSAVANLKKEALKNGVDESRLIFAPRMPLLEDHLNRIQLADLFLDTFPYNAHTTSSDALRMGLPVLTLIGKSFASRVAASLLKAVDLPELITTTKEDYELLAVELATHPTKLMEIKNRLLANLPTSPLYNTPLFSQHIESAYLTMYERQQNGLPPDHIYVENKI